MPWKGRFEREDELKVWMQADPELIAQFVLPGHPSGSDDGRETG